MAYHESKLFRNPPDDLPGAVLVSRKGWSLSGQILFWIKGEAYVRPYTDERPWTIQNASQRIYVFVETTKGVLWIGNYLENQRPIRFLSEQDRANLLAALTDFADAESITVEEPFT